MDKFQTELTKEPKSKTKESELGFGKHFTDHMFVMDYESGKGWGPGKIIPYGDLHLDPAATGFHYGQEIFEGLKAYPRENGQVVLFRPEDNAKRFNESAKRLEMPTIDETIFVDAIKALVQVDQDWVPKSEGTALYIRPYMFATEPFLGVRPSNQYKFLIIASPVGPYYSNGLAPTNIFIERKCVRAVIGGIGSTKAGANYAIGLHAQRKASELGYDQVMWLDGLEHEYVEEIGTSNAFFVIDGKAITPSLTGSILHGITRASTIELVKSMGIPVEERRISIREVLAAHKENKLEEVFASGTAAVISPVGKLRIDEETIVINQGKIGTVSQKVYDGITGIQRGTVEDTFGWIVEI